MQWNEFRSHIRHLSTRDQARVEEAFELGERAHSGQIRKSGEPYFTHPIAVADMLADMGADPDTIIAALLHDTIEDTDLTLEEIEGKFGGKVAMLIAGVTKLEQKDVKDHPTLNEQIETLRKMFTLMQDDIRIMVIKLVDRLHNMQTAQFLPHDKQVMLAQETLDVYVKIADRLCMQDLREELLSLCLSILEPTKFEELSTMRIENDGHGANVLKNMKEKLQDSMQALEHMRIQTEPITWSRLTELLEAEGTIVTGLSSTTITGICPTVDDCYRALGVFHQLWKREAMSFQDFINTPTVNGYQGLHTTVILENGTRVRCKFRTAEMHRYAREGAAVYCFNQSTEERQQLSWTSHIAQLSSGTEGQSSEFWQSLQSDILGESIVIYGPGDQSVLVPSGSTVLDGAFYLFGDDARNISTISVGGKEVRFDTTLDHAASLNISLNEKLQVKHSWLDWVNTGVAKSAIRSALSSGKSTEEKLEFGKSQLQEVFTKNNYGFLEEFDQKKIEHALKNLGYDSLDAALVAIADGRLDPYKAAVSIVDKPGLKQAKAGDRRSTYVFTYSFSEKDAEVSQRLFRMYENLQMIQKNIKFSRSQRYGENSDQLTLNITESEREMLMRELKNTGVQNIDFVKQSKRELLLLLLVIIPWALNPVFAKWILMNGMGIQPLITIRLLTFSAFAICYFILWKLITKPKLNPIPKLTLLSLPSTIGNLGMSVFTYFTLLYIPPSVHLTVLRFNTLLVPLFGRKKYKFLSFEFFSTLLVIFASIFLLISTLGNYASLGMIFSIITLLSYTFYSLTTEYTLRQYRIDVRHPYLLLQMGIMLGLIGLLLVFFTNTTILFDSLSFTTFLYVIICVCIPHAAYSALLKTSRFRNITDLFLLEVPIAAALEWYLLGISFSTLTYGIIAIILLSLFTLRWERLRVRM